MKVFRGVLHGFTVRMAVTMIELIMIYLLWSFQLHHYPRYAYILQLFKHILSSTGIQTSDWDWVDSTVNHFLHIAPPWILLTIWFSTDIDFCVILSPIIHHGLFAQCKSHNICKINQVLTSQLSQMQPYWQRSAIVLLNQVFTDSKEEIPVVQAASIDVDEKAEKTFHSRYVLVLDRKLQKHAFWCRIWLKWLTASDSACAVSHQPLNQLSGWSE